MLSCASAFGLLLAGNALGFTGYQLDLPSSNNTGAGVLYSATTGLHLSITSNWFESGGYCPVRVQISAIAASGGDRRVGITLNQRVMAPGRHQNNYTVSKEFVLPAGETATEGMILVPQCSQNAQVSWECRVDGKIDKKLSWDKKNAVFVAKQANPMSELNQLSLVGAGNPSSPAILGLMRSSKVENYSDYLRVQEGRSELMGEWLAYSSADLVRLPYSQLEFLQENEPEELDAIKRWCRAGGAIWVVKVGPKKDRLANIREWLGISRWAMDVDTPTGVRLTALEGAEGWWLESVTKKEADAKSITQNLLEDTKNRGAAALVDAAKGGPSTDGWYAVHGCGFGRVIAFSKTPYEVPKRLGPGLASKAIKRWREASWENRHGIIPGTSSYDFASMLIPGVGLAPVTEFQILITVFALVIGPLNYWMLSRRQKLHLLVFTTPICAIAVTALLCVYALLADGIGIKARSRSMTLLNQQDGEAVSWARVCHYTGLSTGMGFAVPEDCAIYPIEPGWEAVIGQGGERLRTISWRPGDQRLTGGWLPARSSTQHLVIRSGEEQGKLLFNSSAKGALEVSNRLGADILELFVLDEAGGWWSCEGLAQGGSKSLAASSFEESVKKLREVTLDNDPQLPPGAGNDVRDALRLIADRDATRNREQGIAPVQLSANLLNRGIDRLGGLEGGAPMNLQPRSYVALTSSPVHSPLGFEDVNESGSFHVLVGVW